MDSRFVVCGLAMTLALPFARVPLPADPSDDPPFPSSSYPSLRQSLEGASEFPCAVPLRWRVARVDDGFGVDEARATAIVREAAELWESAVDRELFIHDPEAGFPVRLVFDERQREAIRQAEQQRALDSSGARVDGAVQTLARRQAAFESERAGYERAMADYQARAAEHNAAVRAWNARGDPPPSLQRVGDELRMERQALERRFSDLENELEALRTEEVRVQRLIDAYNGEADRIGRGSPGMGVEAGEYRERVRRENGRVADVSREIRLYRLDGELGFLLVAAHELGHALGLGHEAAAGAVMNAQHVGSPAQVAVHEREAARLEELCRRAGN